MCIYIYINKYCPWSNFITAEGETVGHIQVCLSLIHLYSLNSIYIHWLAMALEYPVKICKSMCAHHSSDFASKVQPISSSESTLWDQCALIWRGQLIWSDKVVSPFWQITYQIGPTWGSWCLCTINKLIGLEFLNMNRYFPLRHIGHCPSNELECVEIWLHFFLIT